MAKVATDVSNTVSVKPLDANSGRYTRVFGIDPGFKGAVASVLIDWPYNTITVDSVGDLPTKMYVKDLGLTKKGKPRVSVHNKPRRAYDLSALQAIICNECCQYNTRWPVYLESNLILDSNSRFSTASTSFGAGLILGMCYSAGCDVKFVAPVTWQSFLYGKERKHTSTKLNAYQFVIDTYGRFGGSLVAGRRGSTLDGRCDAICIATYGARKLLEERSDNAA